MSVAVIIGGTAEQAARISAVIGYPVVDMPANAVESEHASLLHRMSPQDLPDALLFADTVAPTRALTLAAEVNAARPDVDMVLAAPDDRQTMLDAMRAGFRDVAPSIEDPKLLAGVRQRLDAMGDAATRTEPESVNPRENTSRTVAVISPKGGVGKTTTAVNLAVALAQRAPMDVVLVDLDLQFGDVSTVLDLAPTHTLADAFATTVLDNFTLKTYLEAHPSGFYALCGAESPAANDKVTTEQITRLVRQLRSQFQYVVIDTAAGIDEPCLAAVERADDAVMVSTMDMSCLRNVRKELELLTELSLMPESRHIVLNAADKKSGLRVKDVESVLGVPVDFVLPRTKDAAVAANRGVPLLTYAKSSPFSKSVKALASRIIDRARAAEEKRTHRRLDVA